jgi:hypothetical protein
MLYCVLLHFIVLLFELGVVSFPDYTLVHYTDNVKKHYTDNAKKFFRAGERGGAKASPAFLCGMDAENLSNWDNVGTMLGQCWTMLDNVG